MLLTRLPLYLSRRTFSFDLHVLGTSPAFILSQDQTLRIKNFDHKTILIQTNFLNLYIKNYFKFGLLCMSKIITFRSLSFFQAPHQRSSKTSFYLLSHFFKVVKIYFSRNFIFFDLLYSETKALFPTNSNFRFRRSHRCSHQQLVHHEYHSTDSFFSCKFFFNFF